MKTISIILLIILIVFGLYLFSNNYYIRYEEKQLHDYKCEGEKVVKEHWIQSPPESDCSLECYRTDYPKRREKVICINNKPMCICEATLYNTRIKQSIFN